MLYKTNDKTIDELSLEITKLKKTIMLVKDSKEFLNKISKFIIRKDLFKLDSVLIYEDFRNIRNCVENFTGFISGSFAEYYMKNGLLHRDDGPAISIFEGNKFWFLDGIQISRDTFMLNVKNKKALFNLENF